MLKMSVDILKGSFFSVAHALMAYLSGSILDSLFDVGADEAPAETILWLTLHNATAGFILGTMSTIGYSGSIESDPTGGAFLSIPFLITQKNYWRRLDKLTGVYQWIGTNSPTKQQDNNMALK